MTKGGYDTRITALVVICMVTYINIIDVKKITFKFGQIINEIFLNHYY